MSNDRDEEKEEHNQDADIEANLSRNSMASASTASTTSTTFPDWVTNMHLVIITLMFTGGLLGSGAFALFPWFREAKGGQNKSHQYKPKTGFRTWIVILHAAINFIIFCGPYLVWYKKYATKKLKGERMSESERVPMANLNVLSEGDENKTIAERKFYYSYTINDGYGHQIATLGVSISNILFAMIALIRYNFFHPENFEKITETTDISLDYGAITLAFFFGLLTRVFASGVPTFPVKLFPTAHYVFTGLMFLTMGIYMTIEVFQIDPDWHAVSYCVLLRRACCLSYWFNFVGIIIFGEPKLLNLSALSSICELLALLVQEIYILSYIITFRKFDGATSFMISRVHHH